MLIKYIKCQVEEESRAEFSKAQEKWSDLAYVEGFIGQLGGWCENGEAVILGFWESSGAYQHFMEHIHDTIFLENNQGNTYRSITVTLYEGALGKRGWLDRAGSAGRLYVSETGQGDATTFFNGKGEYLRVSFSQIKDASLIELDPKWNVKKERMT
ncbi:MAG: YdbC family protein [Bacillota bacterium]